MPPIPTAERICADDVHSSGARIRDVADELLPSRTIAMIT